MALGRQRDRQAELLVAWSEMPRSPGHVFYDRLQAELVTAGFDGFVEGLCAAHYAPRRGRPSLPPGRYFRMLLVGYFEGIDSERGLEWRCADSLSLREFLRLGGGGGLARPRRAGRFRGGGRARPGPSPFRGEPPRGPPAAGVARSGLHL